jgi:hypothetical protein
MSDKKRALFSVAAGAAVLVLASLPLPGVEYVIWPGQMLASLFWPEGIHSGNGGAEGAVAFVLVAWVATLALWATLFFVVATLARKARAA